MSTQKRSNQTWIISIILGALIGLLILCVCALTAWIVYFRLQDENTSANAAPNPTPITIGLNTITPQATTLPTLAPTALPASTATALPTTAVEPTIPPEPTATNPPIFSAELPPQIKQQRITDDMRANLDSLLLEEYPAHDYYTEQIRFSRDKPFDRTVPQIPYNLGNSRTVLIEGNEVTIRLIAISENAYYWGDSELPYDELMFEPITAEFEDFIYPAVVTLFGQEQRPGIDNDEHINIIHLSEIASGEDLGYFDSSDAYPQDVFSWSNEFDAVYLNMGELSLGEDYYYATLAHEVQHLIHWGQDSNETSWLDEGLGQLAEWYLGYDTFAVSDYVNSTDFQFNTWDGEGDVVYQHYSASALFAIYFWEQLGDTAVYDLTQSPYDGLASVKDVLATYRPDLTLEQFLSNWYVANYINNRLPEPQYQYEFPFSNVRPSDIVREFPFEETESLQQMGVRYVRIPEQGDYTLSFAGDTTIDMVPPPQNETEIWLAPALDGIAATLRRTIDLRDVNEATLTFDTWYDLEESYDLAYIAVSTTNGESWQALKPNAESLGAYGYGINGRSQSATDNQNGWLREEISLDAYAGQELLVSIELFTDGVLSQGNFAVTNLYVPQIESEPNPSAWEGNGFVRQTAQIPQNWSVQVIFHGENGRVEKLALDDYNQGTLSYTSRGDTTIVIAPITPFTKREARYWLQLSK